MANPKKNQLWNVIVPMVDKSNFAAIESAITDSSFRLSGAYKYYRVRNGDSTLARSGALANHGHQVRSGIIQVTVTAAETSTADQVTLVITHPSCAVQIITQQIDSNFLSAINSGVVQLRSRVTKAAATASRLTLVDSGVDAMQSRITKAVASASRLTLVDSGVNEIQSRVTKQVASSSRLTLVDSGVNQNQSRALLGATQSRLTLVRSDTSHMRASDSATGGALTSSQATELNTVLSRIPKQTASSSRLTLVDSGINQLQSRVSADVATSSKVGSVVWADPAGSKIRANVSHMRASDSGAGGALTASQATELNTLFSRVTKGVASASRLTLVQSDTSHMRASDSASGGALSNSQATELNTVWSRVGKPSGKYIEF